MSVLMIVGIGVYFIGDGVRGLPNTGIAGTCAMIAGGILVILSAVI